MIKNIPQPVKFILLCYLCCLFIFLDFRFLLFYLYKDSTSQIPNELILQSFITGLQFDTVIICYILSLPFLVYFLFSFFKINHEKINKAIFIYIILLIGVSLLIICADIPWFNHQQKRITISALQWSNTPGIMFRIIFEDTQNYPYLFLLLVSIFLFYFLLRKIKRKTLNLSPGNSSIVFSSIVFLITGIFIFIGIRGRISIKSPIRWGTAFVSEYDFTNQLGLNPVFTFVESWIEKNDPNNSYLKLMDDHQAITLIQSYYGIKAASAKSSPLERKILASGLPKKYNVILVLMEGMSAYNMQAFGNNENLTPVLDSLYHHSLSFPNFYSDGIHTSCGIYSSIFGLPCLPNRHPMKNINSQQKFGGLAMALESKNYQTIFFTSHDEQFDNMAGFLKPNGFQSIISDKDFNSKDVLNTLGVPDHILFKEAEIKLNELNKNHQPFFATILTSSNHGPYEIPGRINFSPTATEKNKQLIEYADWSIGEFIKYCGKEQWFDSTLFIFTGDHGAIIGDMDMYLTFHRVPLMIYAPKIIREEIVDNLGGQVDIYPTVMGLLNQPYSNNSFGIDLLNSKRDLISFTYDDEYGAFSLNDFYINRKNNSSLFLINPQARFCKPIDNRLRADSMLNFAKAVFQTQQWMIENGKLISRFAN